jgi:hypothetical protein
MVICFLLFISFIAYIWAREIRYFLPTCILEPLSRAKPPTQNSSHPFSDLDLSIKSDLMEDFVLEDFEQSLEGLT